MLIFGPTILDGRAIGWLMRGDRAQSFLGWHFYRREPETFPLGGVGSLLYPVGASLAYTDAVPWFSVALKPLSPFLPATFQISGLWLTLCYALQGGFAFLVLQQLIDDRGPAATTLPTTDVDGEGGVGPPALVLRSSAAV